MQDTDLAWLAGIWDGEGSVALFTHKEKPGNTKIKPNINIVNTDIGIINKARKLIEELGCSFTLQERAATHKYKVCWTLVSGNQRYIVMLLKAILPYLQSIKKQKAEILIDFCERRMDVCKRMPSAGSTPYDSKDWECFNKFKSVCSSQTTREEPLQAMI